MGGLDIHHLEADDIDKAFVLARLGYHNLPIANWRKMAAAAISGAGKGGQILFAQDEEHRARGLLIYAITPTISGSPCLSVERLVAFDLIDPQPVADALANEVMRVAREKRCGSFSLVAPLEVPSAASAQVLTSPVAVLHRIF